MNRFEVHSNQEPARASHKQELKKREMITQYRAFHLKEA